MPEYGKNVTDGVRMEDYDEKNIFRIGGEPFGCAL